MENFQEVFQHMVGYNGTHCSYRTPHKLETGHWTCAPDAVPTRPGDERGNPRARPVASKPGVLKPSKSEWASPMGFRPRKHRKLHFGVDNRSLNLSILVDTYPLTRLDDCIDSLGVGSVFSALDANCFYCKSTIDAGTTTRRLSRHTTVRTDIR